MPVNQALFGVPRKVYINSPTDQKRGPCYLSELIWGSVFWGCTTWKAHCSKRLPAPHPPQHICALLPLCGQAHRSLHGSWRGWIPSASVGQTECVIDEEPSRTDPESGSQTVPCTDPKDKGGQSVLGAEAVSHQHATPFLSLHSPGIVRDIKLLSVLLATCKGKPCPLWTSQILILRAGDIMHTQTERLPHPVCGGWNRE